MMKLVLRPWSVMELVLGLWSVMELVLGLWLRQRAKLTNVCEEDLLHRCSSVFPASLTATISDNGNKIREYNHVMELLCFL